MGASEFTSSVNPRLMQTILRHMEGLRRSIEGDELYALIARVLRKHSRPGPIDTPCFIELYHQLEAYARDPIALSSTRIKAKLLQQHILPYLPEEEQPEATAPLQKEMATDIPFHTITPSNTGTTLTPPMQPQESEKTSKQGTLDTRAPSGDTGRHHYAMLRQSEQDAWRAIYDAMRDFSALKKLWTNKIETLAQERDELERRLAEAEQSLKASTENHDKLRIELDTARRNPPRKVPRRLTKHTRLNGPRLVTREQFLQQMQAEISRVKRSGGSAALALLGIEALQAIEQQHGSGADAAVLDCYAREILSSFRAYDVVGRYGDDAFVVLFPDTHQDGAVRALEKAQKRAGETHVRRDGTRFPLPGFYGALTLYSPGEEPTSWLERAEQALANVREHDGERLVVN